MKFNLLKDDAAWKRWKAPHEQGQSVKFTPPAYYPCLATTEVTSYGCEESGPVYLYLKDIERMAKRLGSSFPFAR